MVVGWTPEDGRRLRALREKAGLTQQEVARAVRRTSSRISELERCVKGPPSLYLLNRLNALFSASLGTVESVVRRAKLSGVATPLPKRVGAGSGQANRQLTQDEITTLFEPLFQDVKGRLVALSKGDGALLWALRRKLAKELSYEERGKPTERKLVKAQKRGEQGGKCARCQEPLPEKGAVLDRFEAMKGYTLENTRLLCPSCDRAVQEERGYH